MIQKNRNLPHLNGHNGNLERVVKERYAEGAVSVQTELCCPVDYDPQYLKVIPQEILEKDYGCGDPSRHLKQGDVVLDLGSGGGKICYIASQVVGPQGKVIGVDFNSAMLALAEKHKKAVGKRIGWHNVEFRRGKIQDLKTNLKFVEDRLASKSIRSMGDFLEMQEVIEDGRRRKPLIQDESVDVIVSNCVLNLVRPEDKRVLFQEMHRVLKKGGRVAISDIVSDEIVPEELQQDADLWSGCISGAFEEKAFLKAFEEAGFYGIRIEKRDEKPWKTVKGIEFRSVTVTARKGKEGPCWERNQAVLYKGPWKEVRDDDQHVLKRGVRTAVCDKTFQIFTKAPYQDHIFPIAPRKSIPLKKAKAFDCAGSVERDPRQTKGLNYRKTTSPAECSDNSCC